MATVKVKRPADGDYYVAPATEQLLQGDLFTNIPIGMVAPPDAVVLDDGAQRFVTGPFGAGPAMMISPSCTIAAQGSEGGDGQYAHPARTVIPVRPLESLTDAGVITGDNVGHFRADRLVNYLYLPEGPNWPESAGLLYLPMSIHHDVIEGERVAQLTGEAFWQLRYKLMAYYGRFKVDPNAFGKTPGPAARSS